MPKVIAALAAAFTISCLGAACTTTTVAPPEPHLSGEWHLDPAASDDPAAKIAPAVALAESKLRKRLVNAGYDQYDNGDAPHSRRHGGGAGGSRGGGGDGSGNGSGDPTGGGAQINGDEFSATGFIGPDFAELRIRLKQVLSAPHVLTIDVQPDNVRLAADNFPGRDYPPGDEFTRIDEYGTARIDTSWDGNAFVLRARYGSHSTVTERYAADEHAGTLTVMRNIVDPVAGKIAVRSLYRK